MSPNKYPGIIFITASFVLAWGIIAFTIFNGDKTNTLHSSAQAWAFVVILGVLVSYGLTSLTELWKK